MFLRVAGCFFCAAACDVAGDCVQLLQSPTRARSQLKQGADGKPGKWFGLVNEDDNSSSVVETAGTNYNINGKGDNYTYGFITDCYGRGEAGSPYRCPEGTWCQVEARPNWYPWDISYMNRGRCLPYAKLNEACEPAFEGKTDFPMKEDGHYFERPVHCGPEDDLICTGEVIRILPSMCVRRRLPETGCFSSEPFCAGRPEGDCPRAVEDFCICPAGKRPGATSCGPSNTLSREKLEQCGAVFNSFNGPNFAFGYVGDEGDFMGLPNDANIEGGEVASLMKARLYRGVSKPLSDIVNDVLKVLWPYKVCGEGAADKTDCTKFPLPVLARDYDGGLLGNYTDGSPAPWLSDRGRGVVDYHCTWMILHALSVNGGEVLSEEEHQAFHEAILYLASHFDCKVCRSNIAHILELYGLPKGYLRIDYAKWFWRIHNHANEHTYATHSPSQQQIDEPGSPFKQSDRRMDMWASPDYLQPWFMSFGDALALWRLP